MIESEFKCIIDGTVYQLVLNRLDSAGMGKRVLQLNYYYDTGDLLLDKHDITFRIRQKDDSLTAEIKIPVEREGAAWVNEEIILPADRVPARITVGRPELAEYLKGARNLVLLGVLVTERVSFDLKKGISIDVDKNYFCGSVDYELEIEFEEGRRHEARGILEELTGGRYIVQQEGKRRRFVNKFKQAHECSFD